MRAASARRMSTARARRAVPSFAIFAVLSLASRSLAVEDAGIESDGPARVVEDASEPSMHTVFSTECDDYFDWQSLALYESWRRVGQRGRFTRLMACDEENSASALIVPDTHVHPNYRRHPVTGDSYSAYNKPFSLYHWTTNANVTADFIIVLDADMIFRAPMTVELLGVRRGAPVSARYSYLKGTLPENHMGVKARVKNVEKTQQVGGFTVMHREDMRKLAPRWLYWTEQVRQDPDSWANTGDIYNDNGKHGPPWISEMYGYVFAAAEVGIEFQVHDDFMLYPGYYPPKDSRFPIVLHYGLTFNVLDYAFSKQWYHHYKLECPLTLFQRPPALSELKTRGLKRRRDLDALTCAWGLYNATRNYAIERCGEANPKDAPKISYKCDTSSAGVLNCFERGDGDVDIDDTLRGQALEKCEDKNSMCCQWARSGECDNNPGFMEESCRLSCNMCDAARCSPECCPPSAAESQGEVEVEAHEDVVDEPHAVTAEGAAAAVEPDLLPVKSTSEEASKKVVHTTMGTHDVDVEEKLADVHSFVEDRDSQSGVWGRIIVVFAALFVIFRIRLAQKRRSRRRSRHYVPVQR